MRAEDIFNESLNLFKKQYTVFIAATAVAALGSLLLVTAPPLLFGLYIMGEKIIRGEEIEIGDVFKGFDYFVTSWVMVIVGGIAIILGLIVFIIPGLLLIILFQYAIPIAISTRSGAIESLKKSYDLGKKNFQFSATVGIMLFVINSLGGKVGVGFLITYPYTVLCFWNATHSLMEK